jgi:hypothetical protein
LKRKEYQEIRNMLVDQFLNNLSKEIGYKFGSPWRYSDKSLGVIVPILKIGDVGEREYVTLEEAKDQGVKFKDSGRIDKVIIESSLSMPIFIRSGTVLKSQGTQTRAVESSIIIIPQEEREEDVKKGTKGAPEIIITTHEIPVRCIYASKGIRTGSSFTYGGDTPIEVRSALLSRSGQASTWKAVGNATHRFMASRIRPRGSMGLGTSVNYAFSASSDNLSGIMEEVDKFTENIDEILKKVPMFEDQVGAVFLDLKDVVGIELFDHPKSWEAIHKEVEKRLGESVAKEEEKTFFKPDYEQVKPLALQFLKKLIDSEKIETSKSGDVYSVTLLKGDGIVGEATSINGKIVHLVGMKVEKNIEKDGNPTYGDAPTRLQSDIFRSIGGPRIGSYRRSGSSI